MLTINGIDIKARYGAFLTKGSYASMLVYPKLKNIVSNDWFEEDATEVDMSGCTFDTRSFALTFAVSGAGKWSEFQSFLRSSWEHVLADSGLGISFRLRFVSTGSFQSNVDGTLAFVSVQYCDDALEGFLDFHAAVSYGGAFGIRFLTGLDEVRKMGKPKQALVRTIADKDGNVADTGGTIKLSSRSVQLGGVMRASSAAMFRENYFALASMFNVKGVTRLAYKGYSLKVVYTGMSFSDVRMNDGGTDVWALFSIAFTEVSEASGSAAATFDIGTDGWLNSEGGEAVYWYDFDSMELWGSAALASDIHYSVGTDGYLYTNE